MTYLVVLAALVFVPVILILLLRANAAISFMGLCVGSVLVVYTTGDVTSVVAGIANKPTSPLATTQWVQLGLLVVPFLLAWWFTRSSIKKSSWQFLNVLPALASGLLFGLLVVPLLSASLQRHIENQTAWHQLADAQTAVVLIGAALTLIFLLVTHQALRKGGAKHKKE